MAETIVNGVWSWHQLPKDLSQQAGYKGVIIRPQSVSATSCAGATAEGNRFVVTWQPNQLMMISLLNDEQVLIDAFATVVEYKPFCKYIHGPIGLPTYEWALNDSKARLEELQQNADIKNLQLLNIEAVNEQHKRDHL